MTIDSNILIAYLNGETVVIDKITEWKQEGRVLLVSSVSIAEVLALPALSPSDIESVHCFLHEFFILRFKKTPRFIAGMN